MVFCGKVRSKDCSFVAILLVFLYPTLGYMFLQVLYHFSLSPVVTQIKRNLHKRKEPILYLALQSQVLALSFSYLGKEVEYGRATPNHDEVFEGGVGGQRDS